METLSVACATSVPGPRVARLLSEIRDLAGEVIVAVDSRVPADRLREYATYADRLVRFEFADPPERVWPWLLAQCSGEWILWLRGDEILSTSFLKRLPDALRTRDVLQYRVPCHTVDRRGRAVLDTGPSPDEPRLVRNDPATLWAPGVSGPPVEPVFPARHLERGYYCMDGHPGEGASAGARRSMRIPLRDRMRISAVLRAPATPNGRRGDADAVPLISRAEIDRLWPLRTLPDDAYDAAISFVDVRGRVPIFAPRPVHVRVANRGSERWPGGVRQPLIRLAHRWLHTDGTPVTADGDRTSLPGAVAPGASAIIRVHVVPPRQPGSYVLELDLVHEFVRWFGCIAQARVDVDAGAQGA